MVAGPVLGEKSGIWVEATGMPISATTIAGSSTGEKPEISAVALGAAGPSLINIVGSVNGVVGSVVGVTEPASTDRAESFIGVGGLAIEIAILAIGVPGPAINMVGTIVRPFSEVAAGPSIWVSG